ncbi:MAG: hypothetical protein ACP5HM_16590 [Anaerolineae bacterium]
MWTIARYQPTAFFSLKPHMATSSGGKTLIVPTPFAVKTALLDAAIRTRGLESGKALFPDIRVLEIAVRLPRQIVVNNTFNRILRKARSPSPGQWPYQRTIGFREYVQFGGPLALAFRELPAELAPLLAQINYLGKRGGFIQLQEMPKEVAELPEEFTLLTTDYGDRFPLGTLQVVDDWGEKLTFDHVNIYSDKRITAGSHRVFHHVVLPHRPEQSSRNYTLYVWASA